MAGGGAQRLGAVLMPHARVGGRLVFPLPALAHAQVDGSFGPGRAARTAVLLRTAAGAVHTDVRALAAASSTEAEWAAAAHGLAFALEHGADCLALDSDCLGVVAGLLFRDGPLRQEPARRHRAEFLRLADAVAWVGVRWVPREANLADRLFQHRKGDGGGGGGLQLR